MGSHHNAYLVLLEGGFTTAVEAFSELERRGFTFTEYESNPAILREQNDGPTLDNKLSRVVVATAKDGRGFNSKDFEDYFRVGASDIDGLQGITIIPMNKKYSTGSD
ncbi:hypothetical protein HOC80_02480 [archaeon]|jgi:hypothetical protein|nr:hypothetical protein [archaeon]MBT4416946.1 hypothetical protein [archaeon]